MSDMTARPLIAEKRKKTSQIQFKADVEFVRNTRVLADELGLTVTTLVTMAVKNLDRDYRAGTLRIAPPVSTQSLANAE